MSSKYPTRGESRPYHFNPFEDAPPKWFGEHEDYYPLHCMHEYFTAVEGRVTDMTNTELKRTLAQAQSDPDSDYLAFEINADMSIDTRVYIEMMKAELAYRDSVDAERLKKRKRNPKK